MNPKDRHCYQCTKRYVGCHNHCPEYQEDDAKNEKLKQARRKEVQDRQATYDLTIGNYIRHKKS